MNYYKKILNYLFPIWILVSINFSQDLNVELTFLMTGKITKNIWEDVTELWYVDIENTSSEPI